MKIYKAICDIMSELGAIGKNSKNIQQGFMYRGIDAVMNALNPLMCKHGIFVVPNIISNIREERTTKSGTNLIYSVCTIEYTFYADDGSSVKAVVVGEGMDSGDKATNKAMSIAFKYACFQVFCIATEETHPDADKDTPEESKPDNNYYDKKSLPELTSEITEKQIKRFHAMRNEANISEEKAKEHIQKNFGKLHIGELTKKEYDLMCNNFQKIIDKKKQISTESESA